MKISALWVLRSSIATGIAIMSGSSPRIKVIGNCTRFTNKDLKPDTILISRDRPDASISKSERLEINYSQTFLYYDLNSRYWTILCHVLASFLLSELSRCQWSIVVDPFYSHSVDWVSSLFIVMKALVIGDDQLWWVLRRRCAYQVRYPWKFRTEI